MERDYLFLEKAIQIAVEAHMGQIDKAGKPYILHPLRVMQNVSSTKAKIVAILHDVIEDTTVTLDDLKNYGFDEDILYSLKLLTHKAGVPYMEYIENLKNDAIAKEVKLADLTDNMDITRLEELTDKDIKRIVKYKEAKLLLLR